jgi:hypothetical protein
MKKITRKEYEKAQEKKRAYYEKLGVIDFNERRATKMWKDPSIKDEDLPYAAFSWDKELGEFIFTGHGNQKED